MYVRANVVHVSCANFQQKVLGSRDSEQVSTTTHCTQRVQHGQQIQYNPIQSSTVGKEPGVIILSQSYVIMALWCSWLSLLSNTQAVPGSSPGEVILFAAAFNFFVFKWTSRHREDHNASRCNRKHPVDVSWATNYPSPLATPPRMADSKLSQFKLRSEAYTAQCIGYLGMRLYLDVHHAYISLDFLMIYLGRISATRPTLLVNSALSTLVVSTPDYKYPTRGYSQPTTD